jgi:hypothetical protein
MKKTRHKMFTSWFAGGGATVRPVATQALDMKLLAALRVLPAEKGREMARLVLLASQHLGDVSLPPWDGMPPEGDPA